MIEGANSGGIMLRKIAFLFIAIIVSASLSACQIQYLTADTLPWVSAEPVLFKDDFSKNTGGWATHEDAKSSATYSEGGFRIWVDIPHYNFWSNPDLNFKNSLVSVQARKKSGPENNIFGLLCRYQDESNYYALVIGSDGYYGIFRNKSGNLDLIDQQHMDFSEVIEQGNAENTIQGLCYQDQLALIVNGIELIRVEDRTLSYGDVGVIAGNFSEPGVEILFDNFIVVKP